MPKSKPPVQEQEYNVIIAPSLAVPEAVEGQTGFANIEFITIQDGVDRKMLRVTLINNLPVITLPT